MSDAKDRIQNYLRRRGTDAAPAEVLDRLRTAFAKFDSFADGLTEADARRAPGPGEWSVSDIADHLLESDRATIEEIRCLIAGERPPGPPVPASLRSKAPHLRPWGWTRRELARLHADVLEVAAGGGAADPDEATAEIVLVVYEDGVELEWIVEADWRAYATCLGVHTLEHLDHARRVAAGPA